MNRVLEWLASPAWVDLVKALLHSFWQGAAIAILLAILLRRTNSPAVRYRFAFVALASVLGFALLTWGSINGTRSKPPVLESGHIAGATSLASGERWDPARVVTAARGTPGTDRPVPPASRWTAWLALAWVIGAGLMLGRAGAQVAGAERLRRSSRPLTDARINGILVEARRVLRLARRVRVAVTDRVTSPAVVGVIVPTLILPLSLVTTLTPDQIRFVLLHELAHIRRGDYLSSLFQLFAEALLFFNPAVWWISHQIRREREACCDTLAVSLSGAPVDYARTLLHVAEKVIAPPPAPVLAFGEPRPSSLRERVQRMLIPGYRPALRLTWRAMLLSVIACGALLMLSAVGTRMTVAAILSPQERIELIERKMAEYGRPAGGQDGSQDPRSWPQVEISGRVLTEDGSPPPDVKGFTVYYHRPNYTGTLWAGVDSTGVYSATVPSSRICGFIHVPGFAPSFSQVVDATGTVAITNMNLVVERGFEVAVVVMDAETRAPIPGARVFSMWWIAELDMGIGELRERTTDANGRASLAECSRSLRLKLTINAPGFEIAEIETARLDPARPIEILLHRGAEASGVVLDATGRPLPGAIVRMIYRKGRTERKFNWTDDARVLAVTDVSGRFKVTQLTPGYAYWLGASASGHESKLIPQVLPGADGIEVRLGPELVVRGRVLGDPGTLQRFRGQPALQASYTEHIDRTGYGDFLWVPVLESNGSATFQFTNRLAGVVTLSGGGYQETREVTTQINDWVVDLSKPAPSGSTPPMAPGREVIFRFRSPAGDTPRGTARVSVPDNVDPEHRAAHFVESAITNGEVRAVIPVGGFTFIEARQMIGYWVNGSSPTKVTNGEGPMVIDVPLIPAGAIYAQARNADGSPAGGLMFTVVELERAPGRGNGGGSLNDSDSVSGDEPRKWVSSPLPLGGTYQVVGWRNNAFCASAPVRLTDANPVAEVELRFPAGQAMEVRVVDRSGNPISGAEAGFSFNFKSLHSFGLKTLYSDSMGRVQLIGATPEVGEYSPTVSSPGYRAETFKLQPGRTNVFRLEPGLKLTGQVFEAGTGYPIPDAEIRAWTFDPNGRLPQQSVRTGEEGRFEFDTLGDASYRLYVEGANPANPSGDHEFKAGSSASIRLEVKPYPGGGLKPRTPSNLVAMAAGVVPENGSGTGDRELPKIDPRQGGSGQGQGPAQSQPIAGSQSTADGALDINLQSRRFKLNLDFNQRDFAEIDPRDGPAFRSAFLDLLTQRGIDLDLSPKGGRFLIARADAGEVLVHASGEELQRIEAVVDAINSKPMNVDFQVSFAALPEPSGRRVLAKWFSEFATNGTPVRSRVLAATDSKALRADLAGVGRWLMNGQVTTLPGREAQLQAVDLRYLPIAGTNGIIVTNQVPLGPSVDLNSEMMSENELHLTVTPSLTEFVGYDDPGAFMLAGSTNNTPIVPQAIPRFRIRSATVRTNLLDGQTLVISGLPAVDVETVKDRVPILSSIPLVGRFFESRSNVTQTNSLLILITPILIDPAGNRIHAHSASRGL